MILDLHNHSIKSDDARAKVENYCQWIRKRDLPLDGFVLTEHRQFDAESDYRKLEDEFGLLILKGSEVETDYGHVLLFGVNEDLRHAFDFGRVDLPLDRVLHEAERCGAVAAPCHPGRVNVGLCAHYAERGPVEGVRIVEVKNGGSRAGEDDAAESLALEHGYRGFGGSDAHIVSHIGRCATTFPREIRNIDDLVAALQAAEFEAKSWQT
ncbi:MAG: PHP-associated domain-containing protein [Myxococcota bacterium]